MKLPPSIQRALGSARQRYLRGLGETLRQALAAAGLKTAADGERAPPPERPGGSDAQAGQFLLRHFSHPSGGLDYKLYIPAQAAGRAPTPLPLLVMLHGCTQSADDFASGTRMNRLADAHGFLVLYPEQSVQANASRCWNWFRTQDQLRDAGEPALIAGMTQALAVQQPVQRQRIFVAGLSAGAAMAIILGQTYPELFAAVGVHSGLPYAAAHDIASAMVAMKGRRMLGRGHFPGTPEDPRRPAPQALPMIVFHGDADRTVRPGNAERIVQQACRAHAAAAGQAALTTHTEPGCSTNGRRYTRSVYTDASGRGRVESWTLHGGGHAWSGGDAAGSYTEQGPDASAEMLRFFLAQVPRRE